MSTNIKTITGRCENPSGSSPTGPQYIDSDISLTRFYGGKEKGTMLQLTINNNLDCAYVQLTQKQVKQLSKVLGDSFNNHKYPSD